MPAQINHPSFPQPSNEDIKLWRYMDFTKFVSLISSSALFFNRSDLFEDPFEGSSPRMNPLLRQTHLENHMSEDNAQRSAQAYGDIISNNRKWTYINCWHANNHESAAMWKLYSKTNESIAIETTYVDLKNTFQNDVYLGLVRYIDYNREVIPERTLYDPFMHKRKSFEHEKEIRAVLRRPPESDGEIHLYRENENNGINIDVNINQLIKKMYVAPSSPDWFLELTKEISDKYDIEADVQKSNLMDEPVF